MLTIICSPFSGDYKRNRLYLRRAILDCYGKQETPFAAHGFFPFFLDDNDPGERGMGIELGYEFWKFAETVAFYADYGYSPGMREEVKRLVDNPSNLRMEERKIGENPDG